MTTDLWSEASRDLDAERHTLALETAKAASTGTWAFLAMATSQTEFEDRLALAGERIQTVAAEAGVDEEELKSVFAQRFALLAEAGSFPPGGDDDSDEDDDSGDDGDDDGSDDDSDSDDSDDSDDSGDDDDDSDDSSDDGDSDGDDDSDSDSDSDDDKDSGSAPPWAGKFSSLAARISAGENPLAWGGTPFVRSSARKEAADGAPVSDVNNPTPDPLADAGAPAPVPGMEGGIAETTKPRQMPEGGGMDSPGMGMDGIDDNPAGADTPDSGLNGGDIEQGGNDLPPSTAKIAAIAAEVRRYNPGLSERQVLHVASQAYETYLHKHAEDMSPLLFGDRGGVEDGPATNKVKTWAPADFKPGRPGGGGTGQEGEGDDGGKGSEGGGMVPPVVPGLKRMLPGGGAGAAGGAAAGEAAGAGTALAEAGELLPLLAL